MKRKIVALCEVLFCIAATALVTWNWFQVARLGSEASYMLQSTSMAGALLWWWLDCLLVGGIPVIDVDKTAKTSDTAEATEQTEEKVP